MEQAVHAYRKEGAITEGNTAAIPFPVIEDGVIVGEGVLLMGGIVVGTGSYIAAHEIVKCDVPGIYSTRMAG